MERKSPRLLALVSGSTYRVSVTPIVNWLACPKCVTCIFTTVKLRVRNGCDITRVISPKTLGLAIVGQLFVGFALHSWI